MAKKLRLLLATIFLVLVGLDARANVDSVISCLLNGQTNDELSCINFGSSDNNSSPDTSILKKVSRQVGMDLDTLSRLKFNKVSKNFIRFFGGPSARNVVDFIRARIRKVGLLETLRYGSDSRIAGARGDNTVFVSPDYLEATPVVRWLTLVHEARHNEPNLWLHVQCPNPFVFYFDGNNYKFQDNPVRGLVDCDDTDSGADAVEFTLAMAIFESCSNCSYKIRSDAFFHALDTLTRIVKPSLAARLVENSSTQPERIIERFPRLARELERIYVSEQTNLSAKSD